ncbi:MFS transporter [Rhodovulum sp. DZ06]|uniref:MFS transporter n=1 Tax=Rhodovulum sp. DZ06 TaxID=3425126 RepID=UPI003D326A58
MSSAADASPAPDSRDAAPGARAIHLGALVASKAADALADPKLTLAWLLTALGAPGGIIGALVPVREAGALLPQIPISRALKGRRRAPVWALGAVGQGLAAAGICAAALALEGAAAGWAVLACVALLALSRAACSVTYKDALARTVEKGGRGRITGLAASLAAAAALGYGAAAATGILPLTTGAVALVVGAAAALWLLAGAVFARLPEPAAEDEGGEEAAQGLGAFLAPLARSSQLRRFILARGLLTGTALAPPFVMMLSASGDEGATLGHLGPLVVAAALASIVSGWLWGRLADRSSRRTMMWAAGMAAVSLGVIAWLGQGIGAAGAEGFGLPGGIAGALTAGTALFCAQVAYEGVRAARKLHLTDMAADADRAQWTALSNSVVGVILLAGGGFGIVAQLFGPAAALWAIAALAALAIPVAAGLEEVQEDA